MTTIQPVLSQVEPNPLCAGYFYQYAQNLGLTENRAHTFYLCVQNLQEFNDVFYFWNQRYNAHFRASSVQEYEIGEEIALLQSSDGEYEGGIYDWELPKLPKVLLK